MEHSHLPQSTHDLVTFRQLTRKDAAAWYEYLSVPTVLEHTSWSLRSLDDLMPIFDSYESAEPSSQVRLAVILRDSGRLVGTVGFHSVSALNRTAELAYDLTPEIWGKGVGASICKSCTEWALSSLGIVRVQATVLESNARSIRVLEKCGFAREG